MQIIVIHAFQICAFNSMDLQNYQEDIIEIGLRAPYILHQIKVELNWHIVDM